MVAMPPVFVSYIRVSTAKQGAKGLGIEAQRATVEAFARQEGATIAAEYVEVETGKGHDALDRRPQLAAALAHARRLKAPAVVAKLCRLGEGTRPNQRTDKGGACCSEAERPEARHCGQRRDCSSRPCSQERTGDQRQRHHAGSYCGDPAGG